MNCLRNIIILISVKRLISCIIKLHGTATKKSDAILVTNLFTLFTALQRYYARFRLYFGPRQVFSTIVTRLT